MPRKRVLVSPEGQGAPESGSASDAARRLLPAALPFLAWVIAAAFAILAAGALFVPRLESLLGSYLSVLLLCVAACFFVVGFGATGLKRVLAQVSALSRRIAASPVDTAGELLEAPGVAELATLAKNLNLVLARTHKGERLSQDVLVSNRILAKELRRLFSLLDSVKEGIIFLDSSPRVQFANKASAPFLKVEPAQARDTTPQESLRDQAVLDLVTDQPEEGMDRGVRSVELAPDEESGRGHAEVSHGYSFDENGLPVGQVLFFRDISEQKRVEKTQAQFLDSVAHELRTPLTSIRAYVEMLIDDEAKDPQAQADFYNIIYEETYRLSQLIDNLLNLSMIESGATAIQVSPVRLGKVLEDCIEVVRPQCESKGINLLKDLPSRLPTLDVDKSLFSVAIMNILGNAVKYTPKGGTVTLSTSSSESEFDITVQDTGPGISEEDLHRIFEKFFRSATQNADDIPGSGIGLSTAEEIVKFHGGEIRVRSKIGEGSAFSIVLPRSIINTSIGD